MNYKTQGSIRAWGNGYGVLLPKKIIDESAFKGVGDVYLTFSDDGLMMKPKKNRTYSLEMMLKGMSKKGRHTQIDFGGDVGKEVWPI